MIVYIFSVLFSTAIFGLIIFSTRKIKIQYYNHPVFIPLSKYNNETKRGIAHTSEYKSKMNEMQEIYNRILHDYYDETMTRKDCIKNWNNIGLPVKHDLIAMKERE